MFSLLFVKRFFLRAMGQFVTVTKRMTLIRALCCMAVELLHILPFAFRFKFRNRPNRYIDSV